MNTEATLEAERQRVELLGQTEGFPETRTREQGHLLSPQVSDILTPAAPWRPHSHFFLFLSCSSG